MLRNATTAKELQVNETAQIPGLAVEDPTFSDCIILLCNTILTHASCLCKCTAVKKRFVYVSHNVFVTKKKIQDFSLITLTLLFVKKQNKLGYFIFEVFHAEEETKIMIVIYCCKLLYFIIIAVLITILYHLCIWECNKLMLLFSYFINTLKVSI